MDARELLVDSKPHAVFIPLPVQGHITPLMKLAQLFHQNGFHITFINTESNQKLLSNSNAESLSNVSGFDFETFDDGLNHATRNALTICQSSRSHFPGTLTDLIARINESKYSPSVSCIISDALMPYNIEIAQGHEVPCMLFSAFSPTSFIVYKHYNLLKENGFIPITGETWKKIVDCIPGLCNVLGKDLPFHYEGETDFPMKELEEAARASGIIFNTFESLDESVLSTISTMFPHVYNIGPLHMLQCSKYEKAFKTIQSNLWEEQHESLEWLDSKEPKSVLYVSFGSMAMLSEEKLIELAWGILNSNIPFLWVMRPNMMLPHDLLDMLREKGFLTSWSPQELVLNHPSIGGFLTHSGWNSTLESIGAGVPMICLPQFGDHPIISRYCCKNWGIGIEMNADVKRGEVVDLVRDLMEGVQGMELKKKSTEWKKLAQEATNKGGSSFLCFQNLMKEVRILKK